MIQKISHFINHRGFTIFALIVMAYILGAQNDKYYKWTNPREVQLHLIGSDGCGYYAYLPQHLIYKTQHFEFANYIEGKYEGSKFFQGLAYEEGNKRSDKYFIGTAICMAPVFIIADQITRLSGGEADGYSPNYEIGILTSAIAYWLLGAICLIALLRSYDIPRSAILFGITGLTFATNLNFYIIYDPAFSHAYTFGIVCLLLLQTKRYADSQKGKHLVWIIFLLGLITVIRPTNLIVALIIPFFFSSFKHFIERLKFAFTQQKLALLIGFALFGLLIFLQFLNVKSQHGYWGFNAYTTEGFDFLFSPKIGEVLFGFRKGFFVYTPFMLLLFPALYFLYKWNRYFFFGFLLCTAAFIYIMASWWCWYYGGSVGMRPLIDIYGILVIPVVVFFARIKFVFKSLLLVFTAFMIHYNLTLNYQMMHAILHYSEMNKERYEKIFMQTGFRFEWIFHTTNPTFDKQKYDPLATFWFDQKAWTQTPASKKSEVKVGIYLNSLIYTPGKNVGTSDIAVKVNYQMKIGSEKSVPKALLFGYRNHQREELSIDYMGPQIESINQFYPVNVTLYTEKKYRNFDSLEVILENGEGVGEIKNAKCTFYVHKIGGLRHFKSRFLQLYLRKNHHYDSENSIFIFSSYTDIFIRCDFRYRNF